MALNCGVNDSSQREESNFSSALIKISAYTVAVSGSGDAVGSSVVIGSVEPLVKTRVKTTATTATTAIKTRSASDRRPLALPIMSPTRLPFVKVEGLGNDFVLLDLRREQFPGALEALAAAAPRWCDRRRGVGADGLLVVLSKAPADARMIVLNADGTRPEMCGNGLRCVAAHVAGAWQ